MEAGNLKATVEEEIKQLAETVDEERKGARFLEILNTLYKFHKYSFFNCMLIRSQKPAAELVAGFNKWKELGRYVKKGEKGIYILAPRIKREKLEKEDGESEVKVLKGFMTKAVFDISQTEGKELATFQFRKLNGVQSDMLVKAKQLIERRGYTIIEVDDLGGPLGRCNNSTKQIEIVKATPEQMFSVLIHEIGHALLEHQGGQKKFKELEAESVSYVVSRYLGLEPANVDYLLSYGATKEDIISLFNSVQKVAQIIISELEEANA